MALSSGLSPSGLSPSVLSPPTLVEYGNLQGKKDSTPLGRLWNAIISGEEDIVTFEPLIQSGCIYLFIKAANESFFCSKDTVETMMMKDKQGEYYIQHPFKVSMVKVAKIETRVLSIRNDDILPESNIKLNIDEMKINIVLYEYDYLVKSPGKETLEPFLPSSPVDLQPDGPRERFVTYLEPLVPLSPVDLQPDGPRERFITYLERSEARFVTPSFLAVVMRYIFQSDAFHPVRGINACTLFIADSTNCYDFIRLVHRVTATAIFRLQQVGVAIACFMFPVEAAALFTITMTALFIINRLPVAFPQIHNLAARVAIAPCALCLYPLFFGACYIAPVVTGVVLIVAPIRALSYGIINYRD